MEPVEKVLRDAKIDKASVNEIVLVGGSTRIPKVQEMLSNFFSGARCGSACPRQHVAMRLRADASLRRVAHAQARS